MLHHATPWARYQADLSRRHFVHDPEQERAVRAIQALYERVRAAQRRRPGLLARLRRGDSKPPRGLYLWGSVGRGKTYLMDCFHECLDPKRARRVHFHRFMEDVHLRLRGYAGRSDPLRLVGADLAAEASVLCFDEFFVSDIADAMILAELLDALFAEGVTLVATSNVVPDALYADGLQRAKFLPAIELLKAHCEVLHLGGSTDYRLRILCRAPMYHSPDDAEAEAQLRQRFTDLAPGHWCEDVDIHVNQRPIRARAVADGIAWFDFRQLCETARSTSDYIELARRFNTVLVSGVPRLGEGSNDPARRFMHLVDEFYDRNVNLMLSAAVDLPGLYDGERLAFEFQRTRSRLTEMQTQEYLAREHRP